MEKLKTLFTIIFLLICYVISGQNIVTDRPDQTESSSTVPKSSMQIESGFLLAYTKETTQQIRQILAPSTLFRYGLTNGIEIRLVNQLENIKYKNPTNYVNGISDLEIGTKIQLLRKTDVNTELAFLSHLSVPSGSQELSENIIGTINKIAVSHSISNKFGIGYNIGYSYYSTGNGDIIYSLVFAIGINEKVGIYIEPYGELIDLNEFTSNCNAGITYLLEENFQLDSSFGTGITNEMNFIAFGFSWRIS